MNNTTPYGFSTVLTIVLVAVAGIVLGAGYYALNQPTTTPTTALPPQGATPAVPTTKPAVIPNLPGAATPATSGESGTTSYSGTRLAGNTAPLLDFTAADFAAAKSSGDLVVLYFYADWCPICREEFPKMQQAFNELNAANVVGFRVNYNDNFTDEAEIALAREHGIAYQHTKVLVKNGQQVLKSPETWEKDRYLSEIAAHAR